MAYVVYEVDTFSRIYEALDGSERKWIDKTKENLIENSAGKVLRFNWFREKRYLNKRLYFIVDENLKKILIIDFSSKKDQQIVIDTIIKNMDELLDLLKRI